MHTQWPQMSQSGTGDAGPPRPDTAFTPVPALAGGTGAHDFAPGSGPAPSLSTSVTSPVPLAVSVVGLVETPPLMASATTASTLDYLPLIAYTLLRRLRQLGKGAFGDVGLVEWLERGVEAAIKCNGTNCTDGAATGNSDERPESERGLGLYEVLLTNPHDNVVPVYGICKDAADGKVRVGMKFCEKGSLDEYLVEVAKHEVGRAAAWRLLRWAVAAHVSAHSMPE
jgi:hypothetical protein